MVCADWRWATWSEDLSCLRWLRGFWRAARLDYEAAARRHEDGQETLSSVLDKLAVSEDAETKLAESAYGEAMSDILLRQAGGIDVIGK